MRGSTLAFAVVLAAAVMATPATAATVTDATGDFLPIYTGPQRADLDVTSFSVSYDAGTSQFLLGATFAGAIVSGTPGFYVIGVNTGAGAIRPFGGIGQGNVTFDRAIVINKDGTGQIGNVALDPASITIAGDSLSARIAASLLPSTGAAAIDYGFNLWPRVGFGNNNQISDFAPENAVLSASVPEPAGWAMMIAGFGVVGAMLRRRRGRTLAPAYTAA